MEVVDWGMLGFETSSDRQQRLVRERLAGQAPDRLILVEHPPVVTIGKSGTEGDLLLSEMLLRKKGVEVCRAARGGKTTCHGPGQLVVYPIVLLHHRDLHRYVGLLLESMATLLREYRLQPVFKEGEPGIWVRGKKIASIGVAVKRWVTSHGIALNVNNDLAHFGWIIPCGNRDENMTSLSVEIGATVDLSTVKERLVTLLVSALEPKEPVRHHPAWLTLRAPTAGPIETMETMLQGMGLATVCQSAHCPNLGECFGRGTATFMILGRECTRNCRFCAVGHGTPSVPDRSEPERVAQAARLLGLTHVVITSVTRDDLVDGGAAQFAAVIHRLRGELPGVSVEVLVPDFQGDDRALEIVFGARPDVFGHNIETVAQLYPAVRPRADYHRSLGILARAAARGMNVKSGLMLGLGERPQQVMRTLLETRRAGCRYLTLGQYLSPSGEHAPVARYLSPEEFERWARRAWRMGFEKVAAGPLVRSSYHAEEMVAEDREKHQPQRCTEGHRGKPSQRT